MRALSLNRWTARRLLRTCISSVLPYVAAAVDSWATQRIEHSIAVNHYFNIEFFKNAPKSKRVTTFSSCH